MVKISQASALIVSSSKYWFNYRHSANAFAFYSAVRNLGLSDKDILLLDASDAINDPRNPLKGHIYIEKVRNIIHSEVSKGSAEVDYRGEAVNLSLLKALLTDSGDDLDTSISSQFGLLAPRLNLHRNGTLLVYLSGHGGDEFFKFNDFEEIDNVELARILLSPLVSLRCKNIVVFIDTCQGATMASYLPFDKYNIAFISSSKLGENSYALHVNEEVGVAVIDRFTYLLHQALLSGKGSSLIQIFNEINRPEILYSHAEFLFSPKLDKLSIKSVIKKSVNATTVESDSIVNTLFSSDHFMLKPLETRTSSGFSKFQMFSFVFLVVLLFLKMSRFMNKYK